MAGTKSTTICPASTPRSSIRRRILRAHIGIGTTHANGRTALQANTFNTWQPRVGFAWAHDPKTTLRGGFGVYSYTWSLDTYGGDNRTYGMGAAFGASGSDTDQTNGITPVTKLGGTGRTVLLPTGDVLARPCPIRCLHGSRPVSTAKASATSNTTPQFPGILQWNVSVQRALTTDLVAEVAYVASHGSNLSFPTDLNPVPQSLTCRRTIRREAALSELPGHPRQHQQRHLQLQLAAGFHHQAHDPV